MWLDLEECFDDRHGKPCQDLPKHDTKIRKSKWDRYFKCHPYMTFGISAADMFWMPQLRESQRKLCVALEAAPFGELTTFQRAFRTTS
jgi:hypothetical protein